jgi:hypothetical protein
MVAMLKARCARARRAVKTWCTTMRTGHKEEVVISQLLPVFPVILLEMSRVTWLKSHLYSYKSTELALLSPYANSACRSCT